jgi:hypothetical protein
MSALVEIPHVIDGQERPAADGRTFESVNPATEAAWAQAARGRRPTPPPLSRRPGAPSTPARGRGWPRPSGGRPCTAWPT